MELGTSKKILHVFGVLNIVFGIIGLIFGILALAGGTIMGIELANKTLEASQNLETGIGLTLIAGIAFVVMSAISIIEGILDCRAVKDISKIMPAWIFAIIGLICSIYSICNLVITRSFNPSSLLGAAVGVVLAIITFMAANSIKRAAGK